MSPPRHEPSTAAALPLPRRLLAEFVGTATLVAIVVGSGIAAATMSPADVGLQMLEVVFATAIGLGVLIAVLLPISGAHFNPAVTLVLLWHDRGRPGVGIGAAIAYIAAQLVGAVGGAVLANAMFGAPTGMATTERVTAGTLLGEVVATAGLVAVLMLLVRRGAIAAIPIAIAGWIAAASWFTSSTSFANPAVTLGRMFSDTFAGVAPGSVLPFVAAQLLGAAIGLGLAIALIPRHEPRVTPTG